MSTLTDVRVRAPKGRPMTEIECKAAMAFNPEAAKRVRVPASQRRFAAYLANAAQQQPPRISERAALAMWKLVMSNSEEVERVAGWEVVHHARWQVQYAKEEAARQVARARIAADRGCTPMYRMIDDCYHWWKDLGEVERAEWLASERADNPGVWRRMFEPTLIQFPYPEHRDAPENIHSHVTSWVANDEIFARLGHVQWPIRLGMPGDGHE